MIDTLINCVSAYVRCMRVNDFIKLFSRLEPFYACGSTISSNLIHRLNDCSTLPAVRHEGWNSAANTAAYDVPALSMTTQHHPEGINPKPPAPPGPLRKPAQLFGCIYTDRNLFHQLVPDGKVKVIREETLLHLVENIILSAFLVLTFVVFSRNPPLNQQRARPRLRRLPLRYRAQQGRPALQSAEAPRQAPE